MNEKFITLLFRLKKEYGVEVFSNTSKIRALLMDLAPDMKKEFYLFINLLNSNAYRELLAADYSAFYRVLNNMENIFSIKKRNAVWIINAFCTVINGHIFVAEDEHGIEEIPQTYAAATVQEKDEPEFSTVAIGIKHTVAIGKNGELFAVGNNSSGQLDVYDFKNIVSVSSSGDNTIALTENGRVLACGDNEYGQCNVENWENVESVVATGNRTIGLLRNGRLVFAGNDSEALEASGKWTDVVCFAASDNIIAAVKNTGKVVVSDDNINVSHWRDIVSIAVSNTHIVGLTLGGYVTAAGRNNFNQCDVKGWKDIIQIAVGETGDTLIDGATENTAAILSEVERIFAEDGQVKRQIERISVMQEKIIKEYESLSNASSAMLKAFNSEFIRMLALLKIRDLSISSRFREAYESLILFAQKPEQYEFVSGCHTIGLKSDGTVNATGWNDYGQCDVSHFFNVKKIISGGFHTIGLRHDKSVHLAGTNSYNQNYVESWKDVDNIYISTKGDSIIGVSGNKLLNAGNNDCGQCDVDYWEVKNKN